MKVPQISRLGYRKILPYNPINPALPYINRGAKASRDPARIFDINERLRNHVDRVTLERRYLPQISTWYMNPNNSPNLVFYIHGLGANVTNYQALYEKLLEKNVGIMAVEYRGHGVNPEAFVNETKMTRDIETAFQYLKKKSNIKDENIIVLGHSMGCVLASKFILKHPKIKELVLVSPMCDVNHLGEKFVLNENIGLGIPETVFKFSQKYKVLQWLQGLHFNSLSSILKNKVPVAIIHSANDPVTTEEGASRLAAAARRNNRLDRFIELPKGGHQIEKSKIEAITSLVSQIFA